MKRKYLLLPALLLSLSACDSTSLDLRCSGVEYQRENAGGSKVERVAATRSVRLNLSKHELVMDELHGEGVARLDVDESSYTAILAHEFEENAVRYYGERIVIDRTTMQIEAINLLSSPHDESGYKGHISFLGKCRQGNGEP